MGMARLSFPGTLLLLVVWLSACSPAGFSSKMSPTHSKTPDAGAHQSAARTPAVSPTSTQSPSRTPAVLPGPYQTALLNPLDTPHTYIQAPCEYLYDKWSSGNSAPGTVVMVIMFHEITDAVVTDPNQISGFNFRQLMKSLHQNGFQAITTLQLDGFLENNSKIPPRSVLLVSDDKHAASYFNVLFRPYWLNYGWPVVNAWISDDLTTADNWKQQEELNAEGWVDYQAHGVVSDPITLQSTDAYILGELNGPMDVFQAHFDKKPIAFIWPGGGFTPFAVALARQSGSRLGFTTNPRGPVMFNWVPLADTGDPNRNTWIPEGPVNDPLMVLPRYWDTDAALHIKDVIQIGQEAASYAWSNQPAEMQYYVSVCLPVYGSIH
jgi:hypothetical protein